MYNEVVGLVGDNGAGKSTLAKVLSGVYAPDGGEIYIRGRKFERLTPRLARDLGIEVVHQERTLAENHPIWRNIFMGRELTKYGFLRANEMREASKTLLKEMGFSIESVPPDKIVKSLSGGFKQGLQLGRALHFRADLVILDEPTIQLSLSEVQRVLEYIQDLKRKGKSCIFITHNIHHVYPVADRFTILDRGRIICEFNKEDITIDDLSRIMMAAARTGTIPKEYEEINLLQRYT